MSPKSFLLDEDMHRYLVDHSRPEDPVLADLAAETAELGAIAGMQIAPEQGALLETLAAVTGARFAVEVGTFTGYSSICLARGMGSRGRLLCCDVSEEWTAIARRYWERAGLGDRIELRLGPAAETLRALGEEPPVDLAFVDADKAGYATYLDLVLPRLSERGLIVVDNVLWGGSVIGDSDEDDTQAIRRFNDLVAQRDDCVAVMLPVADGITLIRRR